MNKQDLVNSVADASGLSKADAGKAVEAVFDSIAKSLKKGAEVRLVGFGTFAVAKRKAVAAMEALDDVANLSETAAEFHDDVDIRKEDVALRRTNARKARTQKTRGQIAKARDAWTRKGEKK